MCSPQPSQEVVALVRFSGQMERVLGPGQVVGDVHPQELGALDDLHSSALYVERSVGGLVPPEVKDDLFTSSLFASSSLSQMRPNIHKYPNVSKYLSKYCNGVVTLRLDVKNKNK